MSLTKDNLIFNLLNTLKEDDLWIQFMESIGEELDLMKTHIFSKKNLFNPNTSEQDKLMDLNEMFGYTPNLILDNGLDMLKLEYNSIPYKIRYKTTYDGYNFIFKAINAKGEIYNYYYDDNKLIKAMDYDESINKIMDGSYIYGTIFTFNEADKNFSTILNAETIYLDNDVKLDDKVGNFYWYLDKGMDILPTKHLGIEYYPLGLMLNDDGEECILNKYWFNYLEVGVEYTRRVPIVPHLGLQLSSVLKENASFDFFTPSKEYTIDDLKLKSATVYSLNKKFVTKDPMSLDDSFHLDPLSMWTLDTETSGGESVTNDDFKYICCGDGSLSLPNSTNFNIFSNNDMIIFYTFDDEDNSNVISDYSNISYNGVLVGDTVKVQGITSKTVNFNGSTYVKCEHSLNFSSTEKFSINFWMNPNSKNYIESVSDMTVFEIENFLKVTYNYSDRLLSIIYNNQSYTVSVNFNEECYINLEFENSTMKIYKNTNLVSQVSLSYLTTNSDIYIGIDSSLTNNFIGIIDSFYIMTKLFNADEKTYIYNNKLSIVTHLGNFLARYELSSFSEIYDTDKIRLIQSHVDAFDVKDEFLFKILDDIDTSTCYIGNLKHDDLISKYFKFTYTANDDSSVTIRANESGEFYTEDNSIIRGNIDYDSGVYTIYAFDKKYISDYEVDISEYTPIIEQGLPFNQVVVQMNELMENQTLKGTITLSDGTILTYSSRGNEISCDPNVMRGVIDWEHGIVTYKLRDDVVKVVASYYYFVSINMKNGTDVFTDYKFDGGYISEVGLENSKHQLMAYMTFPKVEFNTIQDFISVGFYIMKS